MPGVRPSYPVASEPSFRRLGVGGPGGGGDRPVRAQLIAAAVGILVVLAVPLYLLRRPSGEENAPASSASASASAAASALASVGQPVEESRVSIGPPQRVKCSASRLTKGQEGSLCDRLGKLEKALVQSINENVDCAPKTGKGGTLNYVLEVDFTKRRTRVFPGASGEWKGPQAKRAASCVHRSLPPVPWDKLKHKYRFYMIAALATYPPATEDDNGIPKFD